MKTYHYHLLNVFTQERLEGNPLCVFENGEGLSDTTMLRLAKQFNLSETVFLFPSTEANHHIRIFTPNGELPFAGHPIIGSAYLVGKLSNSIHVNFICRSGRVEVKADKSKQFWQLKTPDFQIEYTPLSTIQCQNILNILGLEATDLAGEPAFVNTGSEQLLIPIKNKILVDDLNIQLSSSVQWPENKSGRKTAFIFALQSDVIVNNSSETYILPDAYARFLFLSPSGGIGEDPGTGSAVANLGAWLFKNKGKLIQNFKIKQGVKMQRESTIILETVKNNTLKINATDNNFPIDIFVGGNVVHLGNGTIWL